MKKLLKAAGLVLLVLAVAGLFALNRYGPVIGAQFGKPIYVIPPSPERYGEVALDIMERTGYYSGNKEWASKKSAALEHLKDVDSYEDTHAIIEDALEAAGGKHSFLLTEANEEDYFSDDDRPTVERMDECLYIRLPALADAGENGTAYAETVLSFLQQNQDAASAVIDLRDNNGGDMGPMITAVSPLLPDGEILTISHRHFDQPVLLEKGKVTGGGTPVETDIQPFKMDIPVAVLANEGTGSSAEAVYMAFMELDNVKTFGEPTAGYASANSTQKLYDDSLMLVTTAYMKTPSGLIFGEEPVPVEKETTQPLEEAQQWLEEMNRKG